MEILVLISLIVLNGVFWASFVVTRRRWSLWSMSTV